MAPPSPRTPAARPLDTTMMSSCSARPSGWPRSPDSRFALGRSLAALPRSADRAIGAEADPTTSHAIGEGLRCQVLHRPARFSIFACDRFREHLRSGGDAFTVSIRGPSLVWPSLHDNEDGTYECEWQATVSGVYLVAVMLQGEHVAGSPWAARAIAPGADPSQCRVRAGTSPVHAIAGLPACFDIEFFDALGQGIAMEPLELETVLKTAEARAVRRKPGGGKGGGKGGGGGAHRGPAGPAESLHLLLTAHESDDYYADRRCRASVTVEAAGEYSLNVLMQPNRQPLQGSPIEVIVKPNAPAASRSEVLAKPSEVRMLAGQKRTFLVRTRDAWGNCCEAGGAKVAVSVPEAVACSVVDCGNGQYEVEWSCKAAGMHDVAVMLDNVPLQEGSPLTLVVEPNELCIRKTTVSGELTRATAGERAVVRVHGVDQYGNAVLPSAEVGFGISLRGKDSRTPVEMKCGDGLDGYATDHYFVSGAANGATGERLPRATLHGYWLSEGVFELVYTCSGAGGFLMHLWHRDASGTVHELATSPQALEVTPAASDARGSTLVEGATPLDANTLLKAGTKLQAYVQVADRFGNPRPPSAGDLEVWLHTPHQPKKRLVPRVFRSAGDFYTDSGELVASGGEGTCEIAEELGTCGEYTLSATIAGEHVLGSPATLHVHPAPPDGQHSILVPPPHPALAHEAATFVVQPRDKWGNPPPCDDLERAVALGAVVARVDGPTKPKCAVRARIDGSLDVTILAELSGDYRLHVWVGGSPLRACPYPVRVHANRTLYLSEGGGSTTSSPAGGSAERWASPPQHTPRSAYAASPPRSPRESVFTPRSLVTGGGAGRGGGGGPSSAPRKTSLDGGSTQVFSPRGLYENGEPAPHTRSLGPSASWASRGGGDAPPSTPRSRAAAMLQGGGPVAKGAAAGGGGGDASPRGSPRTDERKGGRTRARSAAAAAGGESSRPLAHSASTSSAVLRTPRDFDRAHAAITARGRALETEDVRSPGELRSPMRRHTFTPTSARYEKSSRTYHSQIAARGGPLIATPRSTRKAATPNFWGDDY